MDDLVSIVIPVFKTEDYLERCVSSVRNQSYSNLDIILVDDGSPDSSGTLCDSLAQKDERIRVIHKKNGGLSSARNVGIENSIGEFICFIDSDDFVSPNYVETLLYLIKSNNADLSKIDYAEVYSNDYREQIINVEKLEVYKDNNVEKAFLELNVDSACVFMYRKSLVNDLRFPEGKTSEDIPFNFFAFQKANCFVYLPVKLYYYYHNSESISNGPLDINMLNYLHFRKNIFLFYADKGHDYLKMLAEAQYARASMGLCTRMCLYGFTNDINEKEMRNYLNYVFDKHKKAFFKAKTIPLSRKVLAVFVFNIYDFLKLARRLKL